MSTSVWPPISPDELIRREEESLKNEQTHHLTTLPETFQSLKAGLEECAALLAPEKGDTTLVLSSLRSESLKGWVKRCGGRVVGGDLTLRLPSLPAPPNTPAHTPTRLTISTAPQAPTLYLPQLTTLRNLLASALDILDVSLYTGDRADAGFIAGQLRLLTTALEEARECLRGDNQKGRTTLESRRPSMSSRSITPTASRQSHQTENDKLEDGDEPTATGKEWWEDGQGVDEKIFDPPLPPHLALHLNITDAALTLYIRTLQPTHRTDHPTTSLRERLSTALSPITTHRTTHPAHDEAGTVFRYRGRDVTVKEKLRVESLDPVLLSVSAKVSALEHGVRMVGGTLGVVMGYG